MNLTETAKLLTIASMIDNRTVAPETVQEWHRLTGDLGFEDAREAVEMHFRESTAYLVPAHVLANVRRIRQERARENDGQMHILCRNGVHKLDVNGWCLLCHAHIGRGLGAAS